MSPPTAPMAVVSWPSRSAWRDVHLDAEGDAVLGARRDGQRGSLTGVGPDRRRGQHSQRAPAPGVSSGRARRRRSARDRAAPADRRQQPGLPGLPRPAGHDLDGRRLPHQRPLRPRGDDDEDARRGAAGAGSWWPGTRPGATFRHEQEPTYKANRQATPDLLREQSPHFRPMMEAFGFVNTELPGLRGRRRDRHAGRALARGGEEPVVILTGDRDAFQLVSPRVSVMATGRGRHRHHRLHARRGARALRHRPRADDRLPRDGRRPQRQPARACPGVGEKGASQLLQKYGSLDAILDHASEQTPKRREALTEHADDARKTRDLADHPHRRPGRPRPGRRARRSTSAPSGWRRCASCSTASSSAASSRRLEELAEGGSRGPGAAGRRHASR